jgi:hypothetical protein
VRHREIDPLGAATARPGFDASGQTNRWLWAARDLDLSPRERARNAEAERLADRLLPGEAARVRVRRICARVAVRPLGGSETTLTETRIPLERPTNALDLDQVDADRDH